MPSTPFVSPLKSPVNALSPFVSDFVPFVTDVDSLATDLDLLARDSDPCWFTILCRGHNQQRVQRPRSHPEISRIQLHRSIPTSHYFFVQFARSQCVSTLASAMRWDEKGWSSSCVTRVTCFASASRRVFAIRVYIGTSSSGESRVAATRRSGRLPMTEACPGSPRLWRERSSRRGDPMPIRARTAFGIGRGAKVIETRRALVRMCREALCRARCAWLQRS